MIKSLVLFILIGLSTGNFFGQNFNRPVPHGVFPYEYVQNDPQIDFHLSVNFFHRAQQVGAYDYHRGVIFDPQGYIAWYQTETPANAVANNCLYYDESNGVFLQNIMYSGQNMHFVKLDTLLQITDTVTAMNGMNPDSHENELTSTGNQFIITQVDSVFDLSGYIFDGNVGVPNTNVICNGIQGFDNNGSLIFNWNSCDYVHPSEAYGFNYNVNNFDYFHMNAVEIDDDGNILCSGRHINTIVKIDRATGQVLWRLGGINSDFTFVNDIGFSGQHDIRSYGNSTYSLFDNGNLSMPKKSRGLTYQLDTANWTATLTEAFDPTPSIYGRAMGSHRKIDNYGVVSYGNIYRPEPSVVVYDNNLDFAAEYYFTDSVQTYRTMPFHLDFSLPRPDIYCFDSLGQTYIKAENTYGSYEWSTGETSQAIIPTLGETYQVYIPYGIGRLGSIPFTYDGDCYLEITEPIAEQTTVVKTVDLLGREVLSKKVGNLYIDQLLNGKTRLYYFTGN